MWIDDDIRSETLLGEGHVFLTIGHSDGALLAVPGGELVSDLRDPDTPDLDLAEAVAFEVVGDHHLVDDAVLTPPQRHAAVFVSLFAQVQFVHDVEFGNLPDDDVVPRHS